MADIETRFNRSQNDQIPAAPSANDESAQDDPVAVPRSARSEPPPAAIALARRDRHRPDPATVYQTLVLTDVTSDVIRKGIEGDKYAMIWTNVCWGVATLYGVFAGLWAMPRFGARIMLQIGLAWFAVGNLLCGAAVDVPTLSVGKTRRRHRQGAGDHPLPLDALPAVRPHGDRGHRILRRRRLRHPPTTPLVTALINDAFSWRWIFWVNIPFALLAIPLVRRFINPIVRPKPILLQIDWMAVTLLAGWAVSLAFCFGWYRKWGGWSSNEFATTAVLALVLADRSACVRVAAGITCRRTPPQNFPRSLLRLAMCVSHAAVGATSGGADAGGGISDRASRLSP